ncbi:TATA-binding protein-associated factor BTAF1 [Brassica rapa]|uniref:TATA-binding protein-associated factor BTAF1 n=1 Tax=Brassica campestris TaxID=3711 RepID=UPI00142D20A5|nr:TATA-binding protein-associated factor BTAF1 [Brassica rapa]
MAQQQQQSSRLSRLLTLLDTGSTQTTRLTAARLIGDIAKSHPQDLSSLLRKVLHYLRSKKWDTRVAASHAIGAIVLNVKHTSLSELLNSFATKLGEAGLSANVDEVVASGNLQSKLQENAPFRSFEMNKVLEFGALLASGGQEYDVLNDNSKNSRDRVALQKKNLRRRLGQ